MSTLADLQALIVDMDGVLYRGNTPLPGAAAFLAWLAGRRFPFLLATNNSTLNPQAYERKLAAMGIAVPASQILTSSMVTAEYLAGSFPPGSRVFAIGESGLGEALTGQGFTLTDEEPQVVVVGLDRQLTYAMLRTATLAIRRGATFVATNEDRTLPTEVGEVPGAGAIVAALVAATDRRPVVIGKPEAPLLQSALRRLGRPSAHTAVLGDRLATDILGGQRLGLPTILVLSGVTPQPPPPDSPVQPTWVFADVQALHAAWRRALGDRQ